MVEEENSVKKEKVHVKKQKIHVRAANTRVKKKKLHVRITYTRVKTTLPQNTQFTFYVAVYKNLM
ncbi:hypothetical protein GPDM_10410 [Planococcus donghaensis MPA1U2]|uniref:Uncharacterized protein n=1 Tax=Planococcus donghaensis MPA1U2 TaxID=933115 RepID=E7RHX4_9BACL|nr:hypothetical protein [Planococcus donghaensis]EGA89404.1 hypothetical protein GPDM_10410 [Planococcus donghaensis MPA1U2]